jgi:hypothetical protein
MKYIAHATERRVIPKVGSISFSLFGVLMGGK